MVRLVDEERKELREVRDTVDVQHKSEKKCLTQQI
jgi:hypothetical protein